MLDTYQTLNILKVHKSEFLLLLLLGGLLFYIYTAFKDDSITPSLEEPDYLLKFDGIEIDDYWLNKKRWKLLGKHASVAKDNEIIFLSDIQIFVYDLQNPEASNINITVTANEGSIDWNEEVVTLNSNVEIYRQSEMQINTEKAVYHFNKGIVDLPQQVDIHYLEDLVKGERLTYNIHQNKIELRNAILLE